jgi:hypothetical protein
MGIVDYVGVALGLFSLYLAIRSQHVIRKWLSSRSTSIGNKELPNRQHASSASV